MERTPSPDVIRFPTVDLDRDVAPNVISIHNARPLQCDYADTRVSPYAGLEEQERRARVEADMRRDLRIIRWQRNIGLACFWLAVFVACYFAFQMGRGL